MKSPPSICQWCLLSTSCRPFLMARRTRERWMCKCIKRECESIWKPKFILCFGCVTDFIHLIKYMFSFFRKVLYYLYTLLFLFLKWCCKHRFRGLFIHTLIKSFVLILRVIAWVEWKENILPLCINMTFWWLDDDVQCNSKFSRCLQALISSLQLKRRHATKPLINSVSIVLYIGRATWGVSKCQRKVYFSMYVFKCMNHDVCNLTDLGSFWSCHLYRVCVCQ